ncbi:3-keto-5-aminohexanoate cleavage protein [Magnetospira thiophila]
MIQTPVILCVAPNGGRRTKADHPALPVTVAEIAQTARECHAAGASMIHLHVRDRDQKHVLDVGLYREATAAVKDATNGDMVVQITTEAIGIYGPAAQMSVVRDLRPEAISLSVREILSNGETESVRAFLRWLDEEGIAPQYILYSPEDVMRFRDLRRRHVISGNRPAVLYVLGRYGDANPSDPASLLPFLEMAGGDEGSWMICAFGRSEAACAGLAAILGGHVRVGFENNLLSAQGEPLTSNADQVRSVRQILEAMGRHAATAAQARDLLGVHL